jgi:hypothetical protein
MARPALALTHDFPSEWELHDEKGLQPLLKLVGTRGRVLWALRSAAGELRSLRKPLGPTPTALQCLEVVKNAGRLLWGAKLPEETSPHATEIEAQSVLPYVAGYMGPGVCVAPLPGLTVTSLVAGGYHEPAVHVGAGRVAAPHYVEVNRWHRAMPQYTIGHLDRLTQLDAALSRFGGLAITGAGYRGVGIPDCIRDGAETAAQTLRYLQGTTA